MKAALEAQIRALTFKDEKTGHNKATHPSAANKSEDEDLGERR